MLLYDYHQANLAPVNDGSCFGKVWKPKRAASCKARPVTRCHMAGSKDTGAKNGNLHKAELSVVQSPYGDV